MSYGCGSWDTTLYSQKIEGSNKLIYEYSAWGGRDSHISGYAILDDSKTFDISDLNELPGSYFDGKPKFDHIKLIDVDMLGNPTTSNDTLLTPKKHYFKKIDDLNIEVTEYKDTYGRTTETGLMRYEFQTLVETKDSLTFNNVRRKFGIELPSRISFSKGNIKLLDDSTGKVLYISVNQFINARGGIYMPTRPLELVENRPILGFATYEFYPTTNLNSKDITNYGVFKLVRK